MATYYWVGGSGNWSDATNHWSDSSGGSPGAGFLPTSADDVIFDAASNGAGTGAFTVNVDGTAGTPSVCKNFSTGGAGGALDGAMTIDATVSANLDIYGSLTLPATNFTWAPSAGIQLSCKSTSSETIITNGVVINATTIIIDGVGGTYTLGSAISLNSTRSLTVSNGTFDTSASNYSVTTGTLTSTSSSTRVIKLNGSSITCSGTTAVSISSVDNLTFNAGTSTITCSATSPTFAGGGQTFYNVTFSSTTSGTATINGANTFSNNLTFTSVGGTGYRFIVLGANQTVGGTLTLGAANTAIRRVRLISDTIGTRRTITLNGTLATLADIDFRDIGAAGTVATPWTGTRLGDLKNNNNITFTAAKTVYWNLSGSQNWSATAWCTSTDNGATLSAPDVNNFPLAQDTATFTETGSAGTVTIESNWQIGSIQMANGTSNRTTAFTLATGSIFPAIYGNVTFFSGLTLSGTGNTTFAGQGVTQTITSAGISWTQPLTVNSPTGTVKLADNLTNTNTTAFNLTAGTLDINGKTLTCVAFNSSNSNTRTLAFGAGNITLTGNAATIWTTGTSTGLTVTGTPVVNSTYAGATGTRSITMGAAGEANAISVNVSAGSDAVTLSGATAAFKNISFSGFTGSVSVSSSPYCYGNFTAGTGMTTTSGTSILTFGATSGTQLITSNGVSFAFPMYFNVPNATVKLFDNFTNTHTTAVPAVRLDAGTLDINGKTLTAATFSSSNSNTRTLAFGAGNITVTGNATTVFSTNTATNLTVTGTPVVNATYAGATGTRTINIGAAGETNAISVNVTAGTDTLSFGTTDGAYKNINYTGFSGSATIASSIICYGNFVTSAGMTFNAGTPSLSFRATSGTQQITTAGKTMDFPITVNAPGAIVQFQDALTQGATRAFTLADGTLQFKTGVTSTVGAFATSGTTQKYLQSTLSGSQATLSQASGTVSASYTTIKDINATGGATWDALIDRGSIDAGNNAGWNFTTAGVTDILNRVFYRQILQPVLRG